MFTVGKLGQYMFVVYLHTVALTSYHTYRCWHGRTCYLKGAILL